MATQAGQEFEAETMPLNGMAIRAPSSRRPPASGGYQAANAAAETTFNLAEIASHDAPKVLLHFTGATELGFGGMETHESSMLQGFNAHARPWQLLHALRYEASRPVTGHDVEQRLNELRPRISNRPVACFVETWWWSSVLPVLRRASPTLPIVIRSGGNDVLYVVAVELERRSKPSFENWIEDLSASVDIIITNSDYSASRIGESPLGGIPTRVVRGGATSGQLAASLPRERSTIAVVARLVPFKQVDAAIEVVAAVRQQFPNVRLEVIGDGPERPHLEQLASELLPAGSFRFLGRLQHEGVIDRLRQVGVLLSMSADYRTGVGSGEYVHTETMGRALCEGLAAGCHIVATNVGGVAEILSGAGQLIGPHDIAAAANGVMAALELPEIARSSSVERAKDLSWQGVFREYRRVLDEALARRSARF